MEELYQLLGHAAENNCNLLLNVEPMADGSIHPSHVKILLELGQKIQREGFPKTGDFFQNKTEVGAE